MYDIDFSINTLLNGFRTVNSLNYKFNSFSMKLNSTTINCSELSNVCLLDSSKNIINGYTGYLNTLGDNIGKVKDVCENNSSVSDEFFEELETDEVVVSVDEFISYNGGKYPYCIRGEINANSPFVIYNYGYWPEGSNAYWGVYKPFMKDTTNFYGNGSSKFNNGIFQPFYPYYGTGSLALSMGIIKGLVEKYPGIVKNITTTGFSAGGQYAINQMAEIVREYPEVTSPTVVQVDAYRSGIPEFDNSDLEVLGSVDTVLIGIHSNAEITSEYEFYESCAENYGMNVMVLVDNTNVGHQGVEKKYFENDIVAFQTNQGAFPSGQFEAPNGDLVNYYDAIIYNCATHSWEPYGIAGKTIVDVYDSFGLEY